MARINTDGTLSGIMGNTVMRSYNGQTFAYARQSRVHNPQTRSQMMQRTKKQNIVNLYGYMKPALKDNFQGKTGRQSDYTMFVSCNLSQQPVYLCENETRYSQTAIIAPYMMSFGKLAPVEYTLNGEWLVSNIKIGDFQFTDDVMALEFMAAVLELNDDWREGDIMEFISCRQTAKYRDDGTPYEARAKCVFANISLTRSDRTKLSRYLGDIELKVNNEGYLCMRAQGEGGWAIVRKRPTGKDVATAPQALAVRNPILDTFTSDEHREKAIASYITKKK